MKTLGKHTHGFRPTPQPIAETARPKYEFGNSISSSEVAYNARIQELLAETKGDWFIFDFGRRILPENTPAFAILRSMSPAKRREAEDRLFYYGTENAIKERTDHEPFPFAEKVIRLAGEKGIEGVILGESTMTVIGSIEDSTSAKKEDSTSAKKGANFQQKAESVAAFILNNV